MNSKGLMVGAIPQLFERLFLISWENNGDCHITMPLSLKTMEVQCRLKGTSEIMYVCSVNYYLNTGNHQLSLS